MTPQTRRVLGFVCDILGHVAVLIMCGFSLLVCQLIMPFQPCTHLLYYSLTPPVMLRKICLRTQHLSCLRIKPVYAYISLVLVPDLD